MKTIFLFLFLFFPLSGFSVVKTSGKMGPPELLHDIQVTKPEGGIRGLFPVGGVIKYKNALDFVWEGEKMRGAKPILILSSDENIYYFPLSPTSKSFRLSTKKLKRGVFYSWYLGRKEGDKYIGQGRVYTFKMISEEQSKNLSVDDKVNLYFRYEMWHEIVSLLQPLYKKHPADDIRGWLYFAYVKLGLYPEALKYK